jgi:putative FmdB family regulatory protein
MPLYEYQCDNGHRFELIRKFSDPPLETCPTCGAPVRKLFSSPAIQFKGSGFYITDYARKDHVPAAHSGDGHSGGASDDQAKAKGDSSAKGETSAGAEKTSTEASSSTSTSSSSPSSSSSSSRGSAAGPKDAAAAKHGAKTDKKD